MGKIDFLKLNENDLKKLKIKQAKGKVFTKIDNQTVIMDIDSGTYLGLNLVGTHIWKQIEDYSYFADIVDELLDQFDVSREVFIKDLCIYLNTLQENNLVTIISM